MDHRHLNAFIQVFEARNITAAAKQLFLTQPALSAIIKSLEAELGTPLFVRQPRGVAVTEAARMLYPHARRMVAELEALTRSFQMEQNQLSLIMGVEEDIGREQITGLIQRAQQSHSRVQLTLESGCRGQVRLGCEALRCEDELFLPLYEEPFVLVLPEKHPLSDISVFNYAQLATLAWVMCPQLESHQRFLPLYGVMAQAPAANAHSYTLALHLVSAGVGAAIVPHSLAKEFVAVVIRTLPDHPLMRRVGICYAVQSLTLPAVAQLLQTLS